MDPLDRIEYLEDGLGGHVRLVTSRVTLKDLKEEFRVQLEMVSNMKAGVSEDPEAQENINNSIANIEEQLLILEPVIGKAEADEIRSDSVK